MSCLGMYDDKVDDSGNSMARINSYRREKKAIEWIRFVLLCYSIQYYFPQVSAVETNNQAFIQTDDHLTYIGGLSNGIPLEVKPGQLNIESSNIYKSSTVRLDPPWLDFQQKPVGMPYMEHVSIQNTDPKNSLHLLSISGSTVHFHCSFFQDKTVPPGGNTTFDVVFLARQEGNVENTLYIQTSQGSITYHVFGVGIPNPYRLRPYLGAKVPVNSSFSPIIQMHNPHASTLQVLEMFSSEGDLHLELPTGESEAPRNLWEIPPFETKTVMRANFIGRVENNHTAFIRIKTNLERNNNLVILPVELEVSSAPGLYSPNEVLDFGIQRTLDDPHSLPLNLVNTGNKPIQINSITVSPPNDAISIEPRSTKLQPELLRQTAVAHVSFRASKALSEKQWSGNIIVKAKNSHIKLSIPYKASVLHGSLVVNANSTTFFSPNDLFNYTRIISITNTFNFSVVIYNVTLPEDIVEHFSILNFTHPVILNPQQTLAPFLLKFHPNKTQLHFNSFVTLHTNASTFSIPIVVYNGLLKVIPHRPEKNKGTLDFGTMGIGEQRSMVFTLRNDNPQDVHIGEITPHLEVAAVHFLGMERGNGTTLQHVHNTSEFDIYRFFIKPYHFAVFTLNITAPDTEGAFITEMLITTQYEDLWIPIKGRTANGSLFAIPDKIVFDKTYPGKILYRVLQINSTFKDNMHVIGVSFQPPDPRFYFVPANADKIILEPTKNNIVGKIFFNARKQCGEDCYVGLSTSSTLGHQWLLGLGLDKEVADTDQYFYTKLRQKWEKINKSQLNIANVTIELDTSEVRGFLFSAQAYLHWPSLVRKTKIKFPLTQIGNISISDFILENPGDSPLVMQVIPLALYPNPQTILDMLSYRLSRDSTEYIETDDLDIFTLPDLEKYSPSDHNPVPGFRRTVENTFGVSPHLESITALVNPGVKLKVRVGFKPKDDSLKTSLILIRNNLTIIDVILLQGQGGRGEMKLSNKKPGSAIPLQFDMTEKKHLKNCDRKKQTKNYQPPHFSVHRSFLLKNTGELPFYVHSFSINGIPCEEYGFKVLDCEGFEMLPNTTKNIYIAFTPDFTMSRIRRTLTVYTSLGLPANYTLQATVPSHMLAKCSAALPRPNWEPILYYAVVSTMAFLLCCILVAAYFEADRIFVSDIIRRRIKISNSTQPYDKSKVFDLNKVAGIGPNTSPALKFGIPNNKILITSKPVLELANGHADPKQQSGEPFFSTLLGYLKKLLIWKSSPTPSSNTKEKNSQPDSNAENSVTQEKTTAVEPKQSAIQKEKPPTVQQETVLEKTNNPKSRKSKAAKRQHTDYIEPSPGIQSKQSKDSASQELSDKQQSSDKSNHDNKYPSNRKPTIMIESNNLQEDILLTNHVTTEAMKPPTKGRRSGKGKQDNQPENKYIRSLSDDKDETSSTSTESSLDVEDKSSSARDSTPDPPPLKQKKNKSKNQNSKVTNAVNSNKPSVQRRIEDGDFQLTSNSKAFKKIKESGSTKISYGGDINEPDSYELDYNPEKDKERQKAEDKLKRKQKQKMKGDLSFEVTSYWLAQEASGSQSDDEDDMSTVAWDDPVPGPAPGYRLTRTPFTRSPYYPRENFGELSIQTEQFDRRLKTNGFSPEGLTSSSRSSSYSSIVSSSSAEGNKTKSPTENKRYQLGFSPFADTAISAALATKPKTNTLGAGKSRPNAWGQMPTNVSDVNSGFGLQTIQETRPTLTDTMATSPFVSQQGPFASVGDSPLYNFGCITTTPTVTNGNPAQPSASLIGSQAPLSPSSTLPPFMGVEQPQTLMQELMVDRRRRINEHNMKMRAKGHEWPGFSDFPAIRSESLWDPEYQGPNINQWTAPADPVVTPPLSQPTPGLWNALTNSANSGWNSLRSLTNWGTAPTAGPAPETMATNPLLTGTEPSSPNTTTADGAPTFDPFNSSLARIWGPTPASTSSGWTFSSGTPQENNQDQH